MLWKRSLYVLIATIISVAQASWRNAAAFVVSPFVVRRQRLEAPLFLSTSPIDEDEDEEVEPGKMRVSEIKAELSMRGIDYKDCFDKESLVSRLEEARATGKADPSILTEFNKRKLEQTFNEEKLQVQDEDISKAMASDGTLPGGMSPDMLKKLTGNPEVMILLQSTKMQEAMTLMMTGGRGDLEKAMAGDPEMQEVVTKLDAVLRSIQ
jgi:hypothetical protein